MSTTVLSPLGGAGWQFFDNSGNVLTGGKLYSYLAGTTTPAPTYTDGTGNTANSNPIILDAAGRVPNQIWLQINTSYKFTLTTSSDVLIWTKDNITSLEQIVIPSVLDYGAVGNGIVNDAPAFQAAIDSIPSGKQQAFYVPKGTYLLNSSPTIVGKYVNWNLGSQVTFTGVGKLPDTIFNPNGVNQAATSLRSVTINTDFSASAYNIRQQIPSSVNMVGQGNVEGVPIIFNGSTSAQTPNNGVAETQCVRFDYKINSAAGKNFWPYLINGLLTTENDTTGSTNSDGSLNDGAEGTPILFTMRATGPASGRAVGLWGGDLHVEKFAGVADGKMVGLEVGVHKGPALGAARCNGIELWSGNRSGITATTAGNALDIFGDAGWTRFIRTRNSSAAVVHEFFPTGAVVVTGHSGSFSHLIQANNSNSTCTFQAVGKTGATQLSAVLSANQSGVCFVGSSSNHPFAFTANSAESARILTSGSWMFKATSNPYGDFSTAYFYGESGAGKRALIALSDATVAGAGAIVSTVNNTNAYLVEFNYTTSTSVGVITTNGTSTTYGTTSDYRLKQNVSPLESQLERIKKLKPVEYIWKSNDKKGEGFIAHELQEIFPDAVYGKKDGVADDGKPVYQNVDTSVIVASLVAAVQELSEKIDTIGK